MFLYLKAKNCAFVKNVICKENTIKKFNKGQSLK